MNAIGSPSVHSSEQDGKQLNVIRSAAQKAITSSSVDVGQQEQQTLLVMSNWEARVWGGFSIAQDVAIVLATRQHDGDEYQHTTLHAIAQRISSTRRIV